MKFRKSNTKLIWSEKNFSKAATFWIYQDSSEVTIFKKKNIMSDAELEAMKVKFMETLKTTK